MEILYRANMIVLCVVSVAASLIIMYNADDNRGLRLVSGLGGALLAYFSPQISLCLLSCVNALLSLLRGLFVTVIFVSMFLYLFRFKRI